MEGDKSDYSSKELWQEPVGEGQGEGAVGGWVRWRQREVLAVVRILPGFRELLLCDKEIKEHYPVENLLCISQWPDYALASRSPATASIT